MSLSNSEWLEKFPPRTRQDKQKEKEKETCSKKWTMTYSGVEAKRKGIAEIYKNKENDIMKIYIPHRTPMQAEHVPEDQKSYTVFITEINSKKVSISFQQYPFEKDFDAMLSQIFEKHHPSHSYYFPLSPKRDQNQDPYQEQEQEQKQKREQNEQEQIQEESATTRSVKEKLKIKTAFTYKQKLHKIQALPF